MRVEARAPGKLILFGEYAVLEGAPAVVAAVDRCAQVAVSPREEGPWIVTSDLGAGQRWPLAARGGRLVAAGDPETGDAAWILRALEETLRSRGARLEGIAPLEVDVRSGAFFDAGAKLGLGSSAAVVVALGAALQRVLSPDAHGECREAFARALRVHHALQSAGSGIDVAASFHGGVIAFERAPGAGGAPRIERLAMPRGLHLACVWTGASTSTAAYLERVRRCRDERPRAYRRCIEHMANVAAGALQAFRTGRGREIVALAAEYHLAMGRLGKTCGVPVISPVHEALAQLARSAGAAYKPSGAGGGDVGLLLADTEETLAAAAGAVELAGSSLVELHVLETGVTILPS